MKFHGTVSILAVVAAGLLFVLPWSGRIMAQQPSPLLTFKYQYKVGVLPFADDTGSGGEGAAAAMSRAVQAEIAHSTDLEGRVLRLDPGSDASTLDAEQAVATGRAQHVDVVLVGTVLDASADQSEHTVNGPSLGGFHLGGSSQSVKAVVTLQGDLYDTVSGKQIDSIRVTGHASETHVGADVSTTLGDLSTGGSAFDGSPLGKALHVAVGDLVKKIAADESRMTRYAAAGHASDDSSAGR